MDTLIQYQTMLRGVDLYTNEFGCFNNSPKPSFGDTYHHMPPCGDPTKMDGSDALLEMTQLFEGWMFPKT